MGFKTGIWQLSSYVASSSVIYVTIPCTLYTDGTSNNRRGIFVVRTSEKNSDSNRKFANPESAAEFRKTPEVEAFKNQ